MKVILPHFECDLTDHLSVLLMYEVYVCLSFFVFLTVIDNAAFLMVVCSVRPTCLGKQFQMLVPNLLQ